MRLLSAVVLLLSACASGPQGANDLLELTTWMTGTFSSQAQAAEDPENFHEIRLVMVPVWTDRADGPWLYVEQASFEALDQPYRQRVYHLVEQPDGAIRSEVYALPGKPLEQAGRWTLPGVGPGDLKLRDGCAIYLLRDGSGPFRGATKGKGCSSKLGEAAYATSEAAITRDLLTSWDRGWTSTDEQAWGATKGPYRFVRTSSGTP